jgi:CHAD domain-containing protein
VIGTQKYQGENTAFRDAARPLTAVRDAKVLVETLDKLSQHFTKHVHGQAFTPIREELLDYQQAIRTRVLDKEQAFAMVETAMRHALGRLESWTAVPNRWSSVGHGVRQVYRQARRAFAAARTDPTVEHLHDWRKQVKYLRYQLTFLRTIWPEMMEPLVEQTDHLGELLGEDHDLAVLGQRVTADPERFGGEEVRELLFTLIARRRRELQAEAMLLGQRLFQDPPPAFARRLKGYWTTWHHFGEQEEQQGALGDVHP